MLLWNLTLYIQQFSLLTLRHRNNSVVIYVARLLVVEIGLWAEFLVLLSWDYYNFLKGWFFCSLHLSKSLYYSYRFDLLNIWWETFYNFRFQRSDTRQRHASSSSRHDLQMRSPIVWRHLFRHWLVSWPIAIFTLFLLICKKLLFCPLVYYCPIDGLRSDATCRFYLGSVPIHSCIMWRP